jgi:hypothetical protein
MSENSGLQRARSLRLMTLIMIGLAASIAAMVFIFAPPGESSPAVAVGLAAFVLVLTLVVDRLNVGLTPVGLDDADPGTTAHTAFTQTTVLKFTIIEFPLVAGVVLTFLLEDRWLVVGAGIAVVACIAFAVYPSRRNVAKAATVLESNGARTRLVEDFNQ